MKYREMEFWGNVKDGFFINVNNTLSNIRFLKSTDITIEFKDTDNYCIYNTNSKNNCNCIDETLLICGIPNKFDVEMFNEEVIIRENYNHLKFVRGDFILARVTQDKIVIVNSLESQYELFWSFRDLRLKASTYHYFISNDIDKKALPLVCYGENVNPFKDMQILKRGQVLVLKKDNNVMLENIKNDFWDYQELKHLTLPELSGIAYELLKKSVKRKLQAASKVGLMLSGGIDSSAIARVLYDLGIDATFITWTSENPKADEGKYAVELSNYLGYKVKKINVDYEVGLIPKSKTKYFPFTHAVSSWWEAACNVAKSCGVDTLLSGHHAGIFDGIFNFDGYHDFKDMLKDAMHAYANPFFRCNFLSSNGIRDKKEVEFYNQDTLFRKIDIYTDEAREIILDYINSKTISCSNMQTQEYSYMLNLFEPNNIVHCSPFLDAEIISFCNAIPSNYKNCYCDGQNINKVILRHSMLDKIPHSIVSRYYSANLSYMTQINLQNFFGEFPNYFDYDSILVKKGILDLDRTKKILGSKKELQSNGMLLVAILIENWLRMEDK